MKIKLKSPRYKVKYMAYNKAQILQEYTEMIDCEFRDINRALSSPPFVRYIKIISAELIKYTNKPLTTLPNVWDNVDLDYEDAQSLLERSNEVSEILFSIYGKTGDIK